MSKTKDPAAVALGRRGGRVRVPKGFSALTAEQRVEMARRGGSARALKCECGKCPTCYQREYARRRRSLA